MGNSDLPRGGGGRGVGAPEQGSLGVAAKKCGAGTFLFMLTRFIDAVIVFTGAPNPKDNSTTYMATLPPLQPPGSTSSSSTSAPSPDHAPPPAVFLELFDASSNSRFVAAREPDGNPELDENYFTLGARSWLPRKVFPNVTVVDNSTCNNDTTLPPGVCRRPVTSMTHPLRFVCLWEREVRLEDTALCDRVPPRQRHLVFGSKATSFATSFMQTCAVRQQSHRVYADVRLHIPMTHHIPQAW